MILKKPLWLSGHPVKDVGDPKEPTDATNKRYVDSLFASWTGQKDFVINPNNIDEVIRSLPRMGAGASIRLLIESGNYVSMKLSLLDYEYVEIYSISERSIGNFNIANRDLDKLRLRELNGSNLKSYGNLVNNRIVFNGDTVTSLLRFKSRIIVDQIDPDTFVLDESLPAYPGEDDICAIEAQGVSFQKLEISAGVLNTLYLEGIQADSSKIYTPYGKVDTYFCNLNAKI